jgi:hypothetical protein
MLPSAVMRKREFGPLIAHLCWENVEYSAVISRVVVDGITTNDYDALKPWFRTAAILVGIEDEQQVRAGAHFGRVCARVHGPVGKEGWCRRPRWSRAACRPCELLTGLPCPFPQPPTPLPLPAVATAVCA